MRALIALTMFIYLAPCCQAEDWSTSHNSGLAAAKKGDFPAAAALFEKSWELAQSRAEKAVTANDLGVVLCRAGRNADARKWLERALDLWKSGPGSPVRVTDTSDALAMVDRVLGDYKAAEVLLREGLKRKEPQGDVRSHMLSSLGDIMREEGSFADSRILLLEADRVPGASSRQRLEVQIAIAELDRDTRNWDASAEEWNRASALAREQGEVGAEAACARGLGQTWLDQGNLARAEPLLKRALAYYESSALPDESQTATVLTSIGQMYLAADRTSLAEDALRRALGSEERAYGPVHPQLVVVLELLADAVARRNQLELARTYLQRALTIIETRFGGQSLMTASVQANWGAMEQRAGHPDRAVLQYRTALDTLRQAPPDLDSFRLTVLTSYAGVLKATHQKHEAADVLAEARGFRSRLH